MASQMPTAGALLRLAAFAVLGASLTACSSGEGSASAPSAAAPAPQAHSADPSSGAAPTTIDTNREVPGGTLTWKIVFAGRLTEDHVPGSAADISHAETQEQWTVNGHAHLSGNLGSGALTPSGDDASGGDDDEAMAQIAKKCNNDPACITSAMQARTEALSAQIGRLDVWMGDYAGAPNACHVTTGGNETADWKGGARFAASTPSGFITIPYSAHHEAQGSSTVDCGSGQDIDITLQADPVTKVYDLSLPATSLDIHGHTLFDAGGAGLGPNKPLATHAVTLDLPALTVKGLPFAAPPAALHGERTLHHVGSVPPVTRNVHLHGTTNASRDMYAPAHDRPAIPLDAQVTWTFTPDKH